jgi:hypothetical protein
MNELKGTLQGVAKATPGSHHLDKPDDDDVSLSFTSSGSSTGNTLTEAFLSLFESLIQPLLTNLDPNLNPGEMNPVTSVIKALLNITVTVPDKDGDGFIKIPIIFSIDTSTIQPPFYSGGTTVLGSTSATASTPTSASFAATLGLLKQQLNNLTPELVAQVEAVQNVH